MIETVLTLSLLILAYFFITKVIEKTKKEEKAEKKIKKKINNCLEESLCCKVSLTPYKFIFDEEELGKKCFIVTADTKIDGEKKQYTIFVEDLMETTPSEISLILANRIKKDIKSLQLSGC